MKKIVVIGGGTGTFVVLSGLKNYPVSLTAIVSMADSGGSNRVLRDEFGLLPTSDIRQCLVALANVNDEGDLWRKLFTHRFEKGVGIAGMTFGNLFMAALSDIFGDQKKAIEATGKILNVKGKILPVSFDDVQLLATYQDGSKVLGEHWIDEPKKEKLGKQRIINLETIPAASASLSAIKAIKEADLIILGPGDLYTSVIANLVIKGIPEAVNAARGKVIYTVNLMTKLGQTYRCGVKEHVREIEKYLNTRYPASPLARINYILINNAKIPEKILKRYWHFEKAEPVKDNLGEDKGYKIIRTDFLSPALIKKPSSDKLKRSLIRHDPEKLAKVIISLLP